MISYKNTKSIIIISSIVIFLVFIISFVPIPISKQSITDAFYKNTKLRLVINGNTILSLTPNVSITATQAYITDENNNLITSFQELTLNMSFKSLFLDNLNIHNILIKKPIIFLDKLLATKPSYLDNSNIVNLIKETIPSQSFKGNLNQFIIENATVYLTTGDENSILNSVNINATFNNSLLLALISFNKLNVNCNTTITTNLLTPSLLVNQDSKFNLVTLLSGGNLGVRTSKITAQGQINFSNDTVYINTKALTNNLNLNLLANIYTLPSLNNNLQPTSNSISLMPRISINLSSIDTQINQFTIDKLDSTIEIANGNILSNFTASLLDTNTSGKIIYYNNKNQPYVSSSFKIDNLDLTKLNDTTLNDTLSGTLQAEMTLSAFIYSINAFKASLTGNGRININKGYINGDKFAPITDMLSTVVGANVNVNPVNFQNITGTIQINNGSIVNNDLIIDADKCYLTGRGSYNLYYNNIDYKLIPAKLINTMYAGIETGLVIEGTLDNLVCKIDLKNYINYLNNKRP
ncbi:putative protein involved in outer membrane biogenesis [Rickettsiales bacterium Ac37b]|nr:putative protein involved in outer membrane biogenesis [Rickettsiales bacterium Ac37b]